MPRRVSRAQRRRGQESGSRNQERGYTPGFTSADRLSGSANSARPWQGAGWARLHALVLVGALSSGPAVRRALMPDGWEGPLAIRPHGLRCAQQHPGRPARGLWAELRGRVPPAHGPPEAPFSELPPEEGGDGKPAAVKTASSLPLS